MEEDRCHPYVSLKTSRLSQGVLDCSSGVPFPSCEGSGSWEMKDKVDTIVPNPRPGGSSPSVVLGPQEAYAALTVRTESGQGEGMETETERRREVRRDPLSLWRIMSDLEAGWSMALLMRFDSVHQRFHATWPRSWRTSCSDHNHL